MDRSIKDMLQQKFGNIDVYLFDQLLKGRLDERKTILDIGCGRGRNFRFFLQNGFEVYGIDQSEDAISDVRRMAPDLPKDRLQVASAESLPFADASFDAVICNAVLHFADNPDHFHSMVNEAWRVLRPNGLFFARLASNIGIEELVTPLGNGKYKLPDGSIRFLVDQDTLLAMSKQLGGKLLDPIKTTNVQNLRCMTTWVLQKAEGRRIKAE